MAETECGNNSNVTNLKHKNIIPIYIMAKTECRNNEKCRKFQAYKHYSFIQYGLSCMNKAPLVYIGVLRENLYTYTARAT